MTWTSTDSLYRSYCTASGATTRRRHGHADHDSMTAKLNDVDPLAWLADKSKFSIRVAQ
jgi:hypothetical protein